ncbi:unnamed protein product [Urochloa humidicola]
MPMEFVRVKVSARGFGGFADLLLETLERAGVNTDEVTFEGVTQLLLGAEGEGWTQIHTVVPYDVRVPEYVPWHEDVAETHVQCSADRRSTHTPRRPHAAEASTPGHSLPLPPEGLAGARL